MEKQYLLRVVGISLLIGILATGAAYLAPQRRPHLQQPTGSQEQCYYYLKPTQRESFDFAWLRIMNAQGTVTGAYANYPGEKDSKTGTFTGALLDTVPHMADVLWNTHAEGMTAVEQLRISFDEAHANAWFGIMQDAPGGHYVYAHPDKLTPGFIMNRVTCNELDQVIATRGPKF